MSISPLELYRKRHCGPNRQSSRAQGGTQLLNQTKRLHLPISLDNSVEIGRTPNCGVALTEMHFGEFQNYRGAWCMKGTQYLCLRMLRHVETLCLQCSWLNFRQAAGQLKPLANGWQTDLIHLDFHNVRGPHQISERAGRSNFEVCFGALCCTLLFMGSSVSMSFKV